ncbi:BTB/POZ domain-containing protein SETH6 [Capsicum baccatum]|uniref:BTB/POZ domain-containing protein SETH6 n=1 Tax=Capsicum baccatum TaxID=33114 RepID=A0A2G2XBT3_CAPBA|nr:BTB/POZ domain-containing protein SETH6 [Capsicum baccatum]
MLLQITYQDKATQTDIIEDDALEKIHKTLTTLSLKVDSMGNEIEKVKTNEVKLKSEAMTQITQQCAELCRSEDNKILEIKEDVGTLHKSHNVYQSTTPDSFKTPYIQHCILEMPISDVASDLTIEVESASFALDKFPLVLRSGRIRKLLLEAKDTKVSRINLTGLSGGSDAFELAAKFCYGVNVEITISNVVLLRCAARFMEMTEDISEKNLKIRTELFLKDKVFPNISNLIFVLHRCETLLPVSEEVNLVSQLINTITNNACKE